MRQVGHVARFEGEEGACKVLLGKPAVKRPLGINIGLEVKITLQFIFKKCNGETNSGFIWPRMGQVAVCCECANKLSYPV